MTVGPVFVIDWPASTAKVDVVPRPTAAGGVAKLKIGTAIKATMTSGISSAKNPSLFLFFIIFSSPQTQSYYSIRQCCRIRNMVIRWIF